MRWLLVLFSTVLLLPACSRDKSPSQAENPKRQKEVAAQAVQPSDPSDAAANELFESWNHEFEENKAQWQQKGMMEMSSDERQAHFEAYPGVDFAEKLVQLADKHPDLPIAEKAWRLALKHARGESKHRAAEEVLKIAIAGHESSSTEDFEFLMKYSTGAAQKKAMELILDQADKESDPEASLKIIEKVATSPQGLVITDGVILMNGDPEVRNQAVQQIWDLAIANAQSDIAVRCLCLVFQNGSEEMKKDAFEILLKDHPALPQSMEIISSLGNVITAESKAMIEQAIKSPDKNAQANAMITLSNFYSKKERRSLFYETDPPELQWVGEDRLAYVKSKIEPAEFKRVENFLSDFIEGATADTDTTVLAAAKKRLFEIQHLSIGKQAPEILGKDLDGVEFKFSDYRGQVVLLDFWGDW